MSFVDEVSGLSWKAGNGGDGIISWIRQRHLPKGGPGGGNGGDGGDIIVEPSIHLNSLRYFVDKCISQAEHGARGGTNACRGANGKSLHLQVPLGTLIWDEENGELIKDISQQNTSFLICKGGRGGKGNIVFRSSSNQAPRSKTEGSSGQVRSVRLELRSMSDVGLVGFPNVGKSSLFSSLTGVIAETGDYHFTTLRPSLGTVSHLRGQWTVADIPGIIVGAHKGRGLGLRFLKHIQRVRVLLIVLELHEDLDDVIKDFLLLLEELKNYNVTLLQKPMFLILNKVDKFDEFTMEKFVEKLGTYNTFERVISVSAKEGTGIDLLRSLIEDFLISNCFTSHSDHAYSSPVTPL